MPRLFSASGILPNKSEDKYHILKNIVEILIKDMNQEHPHQIKKTRTASQ